MNLYDAIIQDKINIKRAEHQRKFGKPMSDEQQQWEEIKLRLPRALKGAVILTLIIAAVYAIFSPLVSMTQNTLFHIFPLLHLSVIGL